MFTEERRQIIVSALSVHRSLSVADLARMVRSSEVTVRRDLRFLEDSGKVVRHRGGASVARLVMDEPTYLDKSVVAAEEKLAIAATASDLVDDGDVLMLCAGTTTQALARALRHRHLFVATNSMLVAAELYEARDVEVLVIGGVMRGNIRAVIGGEAEKALGRLRFKTTFLSGNGLTATHGLSTPNVHVASLDRAAAESAERVVVVADHTKVGIDSVVQTVPCSRIDVLVTDDSADPDELRALEEAGVEVHRPDTRLAAVPGPVA